MSASEERVLAYAATHEVDCPDCAYPLRGLAAARCPECGRRLTMALLLGPRHRPISAAGWVVMAGLLAANVYMVWRLWYHPASTSVWEALFVRTHLSARHLWWRPGGFGLLPIINAGLVLYAWRLDEAVGMGLRRWHLLGAGAVLTGLYVVVGSTM